MSLNEVCVGTQETVKTISSLLEKNIKHALHFYFPFIKKDIKHAPHTVKSDLGLKKNISFHYVCLSKCILLNLVEI